MRKHSIFAVVLCAMLGIAAPSQAGLKIILLPAGGTGGTPPANIKGGGDLATNARQAADYWEKIYSDPNQEWTLELTYGWGPLSGTDGLNGQFTLGTAGGTPNRVLSGTMMFNNTGGTLWFADPNPGSNSAYADVVPVGSLYSTTSNPDGVYLNSGFWFVNPTNQDAVDRFDLLTVVMHEIGHALGMLNDPPHFTCPNSYEISEAVSQRYAGLYNVLTGVEHLFAPSLMMLSAVSGIRQFPTGLDILTFAELNGYSNPDWYSSLELFVNGLPGGAKNGLLAKLQNSRAHRDAGNGDSARNQLNAFINQVKKNPGGRFTQDQIDSLVSMAETQIEGI